MTTAVASWRMDVSYGGLPKHWSFYAGEEELPRFTLGELTDHAAVHVLEALNAYDRATSGAASTAPSVAQTGGAEVEPAWDAAEGVPA